MQFMAGYSVYFQQCYHTSGSYQGLKISAIVHCTGITLWILDSATEPLLGTVLQQLPAAT